MGQWIGHVLRMHLTSVSKVLMMWIPTCKKKRGTPKDNWRRSVEKRRRTTGHGDRIRDGHMTDQHGDLWIRPFVLTSTKRTTITEQNTL